ncbi:DUF2971 domain-containing protein [Methylobacterium sp. Leaf86]|uniref:DUF2971 domain-containing protein n=1 Tax=Methylobacterium sp. Leaf86 TaxID=1736242 RepID=UPI001FCD04F9|nr:DUF2971 domain-containing protein [Methylobacterium sp. Leaf86]
MIYTFAQIGAATAMRVEDVSLKNRRLSYNQRHLRTGLPPERQMIIYKYMDAITLNLVLDSFRIAFAHPSDFNDPFDRPRVSRRPYTLEYHSLFTGELMTREAQAAEADEAWNKCAVSSFTRTHDNALMWAHYADKHKGAVIEIDAREAGLTSTELLIPVQFGSVIYMKRQNPEESLARGFDALRSQAVTGGENRFEIRNYEGLQRLFLTKPMPWSYEEEVRAVCSQFLYRWDDQDESFEGQWKRIVKADGNPIYGLRIPSRSITRIFAGLRYENLGMLRERCTREGIRLMLPINEPSNGYEMDFEPDPYSDR